MFFRSVDRYLLFQCTERQTPHFMLLNYRNEDYYRYDDNHREGCDPVPVKYNLMNILLIN